MFIFSTDSLDAIEVVQLFLEFRRNKRAGKIQARVPVFVVVVFKKKVSKTVSQLNQYLLEKGLTFKNYDRHAHMVLKNN